jgi:hypothetical protein
MLLNGAAEHFPDGLGARLTNLRQFQSLDSWQEANRLLGWSAWLAWGLSKGRGYADRPLIFLHTRLS